MIMRKPLPILEFLVQDALRLYKVATLIKSEHIHSESNFALVYRGLVTRSGTVHNGQTYFSVSVDCCLSDDKKLNVAISISIWGYDKT